MNSKARCQRFFCVQKSMRGGSVSLWAEGDFLVAHAAMCSRKTATTHFPWPLKGKPVICYEAQSSALQQWSLSLWVKIGWESLNKTPEGVSFKATKTAFWVRMEVQHCAFSSEVPYTLLCLHTFHRAPLKVILGLFLYIYNFFNHFYLMYLVIFNLICHIKPLKSMVPNLFNFKAHLSITACRQGPLGYIRWY